MPLCRRKTASDIRAVRRGAGDKHRGAAREGGTKIALAARLFRALKENLSEAG